MGIKNKLRNFLNKLPHVRGLYQENLQWKHNSRVPPGHYYSPIVSLSEVQKREAVIWNENLEGGLSEISLNTDLQKQLLRQFEDYYKELPFPEEPLPEIKYHYNNTYYSYTDGIMLYSMIRHKKPNRIVEIGSGFSSAVMMDVNRLFFNNSINLTFIEPYPDRLKSLMAKSETQNVTLLQEDAQNISLEVFKSLKSGDILFIDSSHIVKTGSDVNYILFQILPILNNGVVIHFHDIFYPFEYSKQWVLNGHNWNETYFLKSFLMYNKSFQILLFSDFMHKFYKNSFENMPLTYKNTGGNLWLQKTSIS